jgi:hypothetical protein
MLDLILSLALQIPHVDRLPVVRCYEQTEPKKPEEEHRGSGRKV